ncbi:MAG: DEAD/DEAH box helicase, partial [Actinomycetota bacterium]|nr:DEAD/DEAH box helicase [Actinomycetota bacterium]
MPLTATRVPAGFAGLVQCETWPALRGRPRPETLETPLDVLAGVGPALTRKLAKLGLSTVRDLLEHRPHRYEAAVPERRIADLFGDDEVAIHGEVRSVRTRPTGRRLTLLEARIADETGEIGAVWFNQPWLAAKLQPGTRVRLRGQLRRSSFAVRAYDVDDVSATADFAPVYPASEELTPKRLRELVEAALRHAPDVPDPLPAALAAQARLPRRADAVVALHRPRSLEEAEAGRRRLAFDELLRLQLGLAKRAEEREEEVAAALGYPGELVTRYRAVLPFALTPEQERVIAEIDADLERPRPMQRLLQGDVGSGKTVVALYALLRAVENGRQGALMAPTETLAEQHFLTLEEACTALGVRCALLTSALSQREHARVRDEIASGEVDIAVGTHALIQREVEFRDLALAVVDEQHRFGVEQRRAIAHERSPHLLHMTATPIPRTLALTIYGDLDVSEITRAPANRSPVVTAWVTEERSAEAYRRLRGHLEAGRQAYVVCPLVEESATSEARAAEQEAERLRRAELR